MPTRLRSLVAFFVGVAAITWGALRIAESRGSVLPQLPWAAPASIAALGIAVLLSAVALRRRLAGAPGSKPPHPIAVSRLAVLGKTSSHVGAVLGGMYGGYLLLLVDELHIGGRRDRAVVALVAVLASLLLVVGGLVLERACRLPPSEEEIPPTAV